MHGILIGRKIFHALFSFRARRKGSWFRLQKLSLSPVLEMIFSNYYGSATQRTGKPCVRPSALSGFTLESKPKLPADVLLYKELLQ